MLVTVISRQSNRVLTDWLDILTVPRRTKIPFRRIKFSTGKRWGRVDFRVLLRNRTNVVELPGRRLEGPLLGYFCRGDWV